MAINNIIDQPIERLDNDNFEIKPYVDGVAKFIIECSTTPMTIAIQGDWGTGKTSIMNMVKSEIECKNKVKKCIDFNTWMFSQFGTEDNLPLVFMTKLLLALGGKKDIDVKALAKKVTELFANIAVGHLSGGSANVDSFTDSIINYVDKVEKLKEEFEKQIEIIAPKNDDKVVIFIDDLDRLQPGKAVELLGTLKIFLDCKKCIFVLAIDYDVVCRGVQEKYGKDFNEEKGRSFFDKIIQVPFKMPVSDYNIKEYVKINLKNIGVLTQNEQSVARYTKLVEYSTGRNPRSMKRLFNSFMLLKCIAVSKKSVEARYDELLFALLCMQTKFDKAYDYFIANRNNISIEFLDDLKFAKSDKLSEIGFDDSEEAEEFKTFFDIFYSVIDSNDSKNIDEKEIQVLKEVLEFSSITDSNSKVKRGKTCSTTEFIQMNGDANGLYYFIYDMMKELMVASDSGPWPHPSGAVTLAVTENGKHRTVINARINKSGFQVYFNLKNISESNIKKYADKGCKVSGDSNSTLSVYFNLRDDERQKVQIKELMEMCLKEYR